MKKIFEKSEIIFAAVLLISFFLPWFNSYSNYSGYFVPLLLKWIPYPYFDPSKVHIIINILCYLFLLIYLIPILSSLVIIQGLRKKITKYIAVITGLIPFILLIYLLITYPHIILHQLLFGAWTTLASALGLILSSFGLFKLKNDGKKEQVS